MSLTTIPLEKETRNKLRSIASKAESWDAVLNRLYENEITRRNAAIFFSADTISADELLERIEKW